MPYAMNAQGIFEVDLLGRGKKIVDFFKDDVSSKKEIKKLCNSLGAAKRINNSTLGAEIAITNLTYVHQRVVQQRFYRIKPSDYLPVSVGQGAFMTHTVQYRSYQVGDGGFEESLMDTGADNPRQHQANFAIDSLTIPHKQFLRGYQYNIFEINQLSQLQVTKSPIELKEEARKTSWDLGIQQVAFLGLNGDPSVQGLLNLTGVYSDTTTLTQSLSSMTTDQFFAFIATILPKYFANTNNTALPDRFYIPYFDLLGLGEPCSFVAPFNTRIDYLENAFKKMTGNPDFKIQPLLYCDQTQNNLGKNRYVLMRYDEDVARMSIPIDYTTTVVDTANGMEWAGSSYGQFTGVIGNLLQYMYYLDWTNP
jgi:hypothetical protein